MLITLKYSQAIIVSNVELALNYCSRFYGRQFITRKSVNTSVAVEVEKVLGDYFREGRLNEQGLPTVEIWQTRSIYRLAT